VSSGDGGHDAEREVWRRILRRTTFVTYGFLVAAIAIAIGGSALLAWLLIPSGAPFRQTWLVLSVLMLLIPFGIFLIQRWREKMSRPNGGGD
jgi:integral membrane sensor domain MASE1